MVHSHLCIVLQHTRQSRTCSRIQSYYLFCFVWFSFFFFHFVNEWEIGKVDDVRNAYVRLRDDVSKWSTLRLIRFRTRIHHIKSSRAVCDCAWVTHQEYRISNLILHYSSQYCVSESKCEIEGEYVACARLTTSNNDWPWINGWMGETKIFWNTCGLMIFFAQRLRAKAFGSSFSLHPSIFDIIIIIINLWLLMFPYSSFDVWPDACARIKVLCNTVLHQFRSKTHFTKEMKFVCAWIARLSEVARCCICGMP